MPLVRTAMEVLEEKAALWRPLVKEFCDHYRQKPAEQSLEEYIMSELGFDLGENPKGRVLMPDIVACNGVFFYESRLQTEENGEQPPDRSLIILCFIKRLCRCIMMRHWQLVCETGARPIFSERASIVIRKCVAKAGRPALKNAPHSSPMLMRNFL